MTGDPGEPAGPLDHDPVDRRFARFEAEGIELAYPTRRMVVGPSVPGLEEPCPSRAMDPTAPPSKEGSSSLPTAARFGR